MSRLAGVVLAAGHGTRLRPLTTIKPKALCPVNNEPLLDRAMANLVPVTDGLAVNAHAFADQVAAFVGDRAHVSVESGEALGTAGALAHLQAWIDGRDVLVHNADAWHDADVEGFVDGWDGTRIRLLVVRTAEPSDFGHFRYAGLALMPWRAIEPLRAEPSGLYEVSWRAARERGDLDLCQHLGAWFDCGTPATYLAANLHASGGQSVVGEGAVVDGELHRSVVWPGGVVREDERLVECIRAGTDVTVDGSA